MPINRDYEKFLVDFHSKKFVSLRESQRYALKEYADNFTTVSDVAIELPTGAGKTLISLLVAEAWRQEGRKVAILSANKTLARQMLQEAQALGIPAVLMEGRGQDIPASDNKIKKQNLYKRRPRTFLVSFYYLTTKINWFFYFLAP